MSVSLGAKGATLTDLPTEIQQSIYINLPPTQIASLATLSTSTTPVIHDKNLWSEISKRTLQIFPENPTQAAVRSLADSLVCRWWLLTGLFVPGVPVHRRSGFCQVSARGGVELPIVHPEKDSCYVFGAQYASAAIPVLNPSVSLCFFLDPSGPFPVDGMRLSLVHTIEIPEEADEQSGDVPSYLNLGPAVTAHHEQLQDKCEEPYAAVTVRVNNEKLLTSFRPKPANFQVTHIRVPAHLLVTKPRMNHISVEYDRSSTAAYWLKHVSIMPSILPPPLEETTETAIRIGEPLPQPQPERLETASVQPAPRRHPVRVRYIPQSPPNRHNQNHSHHRRPVRRLTEQSFKQHVSDAHTLNRYQNAQAHHFTAKPKHVYHHNYYRSPRRSSPNSPGARSAR